MTDEEGQFAREVSAMKGVHMFNHFYDKIRETQEFFVRYPGASGSYEPTVDMEVDVPFSGEEVFGKYMDLHALYSKYINIPNIGNKDQDYLQYLERFNTFFYIQETVRKSKQYAAYINELADYISSFYQRVNPLVDIAPNIREWRETFEKNWDAKSIAGWSKVSGKKTHNAQPLRLGTIFSLALSRVIVCCRDVQCGGGAGGAGTGAAEGGVASDESQVRRDAA